MANKIDDVRSTIKFQIKKTTCLAVAVGNVKMTEEELNANIILAINFLVTLFESEVELKVNITRMTHLNLLCHPPRDVSVYFITTISVRFTFYELPTVMGTLLALEAH